MIESVERQLGRRLDTACRGATRTLNEITPDMLRELRLLDPSSVNTYLQFHLAPGSTPFFEDFARDVIRGVVSPESWGYRDLIAVVREPGRGGALKMSAEGARDMLAGVEGARWERRSIGVAVEVNRRGGESTWGAPGVLVRHAPYSWEPPRNEIALSVVSEPTDSVSEKGFLVAFRRWIALRVAWWAGHARIDLATSSEKEVAAVVGVEWALVSRDGAVALEALRQEAQLAFDPSVHVRGFVGPDEWYST